MEMSLSQTASLLGHPSAEGLPKTDSSRPETRNTPIRIAISSADGKTVHQHFGRTTQFVVCEIEGRQVRYLERRSNQPACGTAVEEGEGHDEDRMEQTIGLVADCRAVVSAQIGYGAIQRLAARGIQAYVIPDFIDSALQRLIRSGALEDGSHTVVRRTVA
jgi:predicted Fe-Mo cluster-binding NifX family protein